MNKHSKILLLALALCGSAFTLTAQDATNPPPTDLPPPQDGGPGGPGPGHHPPPPCPLLLALDANGDGVIDEQEMANAPAALKKLDKNGDGVLTQDELRPPPPPLGQRGPRGPGGPGFRRPPGDQQGGDQSQPPQTSPQQ